MGQTAALVLCNSTASHPFLSAPMHLLFVADSLELFKIYKDTTFSMMREAQRRGHRIAAC